MQGKARVLVDQGRHGFARDVDDQTAVRQQGTAHGLPRQFDRQLDDFIGKPGAQCPQLFLEGVCDAGCTRLEPGQFGRPRLCVLAREALLRGFGARVETPRISPMAPASTLALFAR